MLESITAKVHAGERLDRKDGQWLLDEAPLLEVGSLAKHFNAFVAKFLKQAQVACLADCRENFKSSSGPDGVAWKPLHRIRSGNRT